MRSLLLVLALAACAVPDPASPITHAPSAPSFNTYDATRPAPTNVSAFVVATDPARGLITVRVTFTDTAEGETLVSAYFTDVNDNGPAATQNIGGTVEASGDRTVDVAVPTGSATLRLRNVWGTIPGDGADIVWGPFSDAATIGSSTTATIASCKGRKCR